MEDDFHKWLINHWPTLVNKVGNLEGQQKVLMAGVGFLIVLVSGLIALVATK